MEAQVLHVTVSREVKRLEDRVVSAVEFEGRGVESLAQGAVERRRGLDPSPFQKKLYVAVKGKYIRAQGSPQLLRAEVISDVSKTQATRDPHNAGSGGQKDCLLDAESLSSLQHRAGTVSRWVEHEGIGVVADLVAYGIIYGNTLINL